jgi:hypothetical protein
VTSTTNSGLPSSTVSKSSGLEKRKVTGATLEKPWNSSVSASVWSVTTSAPITVGPGCGKPARSRPPSAFTRRSFGNGSR